MAVPEPPPPSLIFDFVQFDEDDPVDMEMSQAYKQLMESIQGMSEIDIHNQLQASASVSMQKHAEIINGLLYGILTYNSNSGGNPGSTTSSLVVPAQNGNSNKPTPPDLFRHMNFVARDSLAFAVKQTRYFCSLLHFHKIRPQAREQILWLVGQLTEIRVHGVEQLYMILLRQIRGGDVSQANVQHAEAMLRLLQTHLQPWVYSIPMLVAYSCFTYLRIMLDHGRLTNLRQQEAIFCAKLLRERFRDCSDIGRDLVRALQDVARIKEIEEIWVDLLYSPEKLNPQLEGIHQLMAMPSKDIFLASRLTFDMEHKLLHILKYINLGQHNRNLQWLTERYLTAPETDALYCDIIRYICGVYHPTNAVLASSIVPRYVFIGSLLRNIKSNVSAANVKLALFYDWLFYDPSKDSIMNIEPAMLLMERSVERYPYMTAILLEFLQFTVDNYYPPLREYIQKHVGMAAQALVEKGVIRSFRFIYRSPSLEDYPPVREYMLSLFPAQLGDIAENTAGSLIGGSMSMENIEDHSIPTRSGSDNDDNEGVDEFESSPPHSGFVAQGIAGQDGDDDDDDPDQRDVKSRSQSRESSREPMSVDEQAIKDEYDDIGGEEEVMESYTIESVAQDATGKPHNASVLADWSFTDDLTSGTTAGKVADVSSGSNPIPGASLWIFGSSLQEFKKAYETDPEAPSTAKMFRHIWEVYGDVAGAGVEGSDIAHEIGQEILAFAHKAEIPESYVCSVSEDQDEDADAMEPLMSCLWKVTARDGKDGALRVAQMFLSSEANINPRSRQMGMWFLLGLLRGQKRSKPNVNISVEQVLQLYGSYIRASVRQDQMDNTEESNAEASSDSMTLGQQYLLADLHNLHSRQTAIFDSLLPLVLEYLPELIPRTEAFLKLMLIMATPTQIYRLSTGLAGRTFWLISTPVTSRVIEQEDKESKKGTKITRAMKKKNASQEKTDELETDSHSLADGRKLTITPQALMVLEQTLSWETYEQLGLWQLILSEIGGVSEAVVSLLNANWVPNMNTESKAEAMSGLLNLVRSLAVMPPTVSLGRAIARIAAQTEIISEEMRQFCESHIALWARGYPDHVAAILLSLSDKTSAPVNPIIAATLDSSISADGDLEMEDVSMKSKMLSKNTRTKNGSATVAKTKLTPTQRKEQATHLRAVLSLLQVWWDDMGLSLSSSSTKGMPLTSMAKRLFSRIWPQQVQTQVLEALTESFGTKEKNSWPEEWWVKENEDNKNRRRGGRRDGKSEDDGENEGSEDNDGEDSADQSDDDEEKEEANQGGESDGEQNSDNEKKSKDKKRFGGAASSSAGSSRRNSPKVGSGILFGSSNSGTKKISTVGSTPAAKGVLGSRSRGKSSPAPSTRKTPAKRVVATRKRKISEDDDEEEDQHEDEEEEEEEDDQEGEEEENEEDDEDDEGEDEDDTKIRKRTTKRPTENSAKNPKTRLTSRNKSNTIGKRRILSEDESDD
ncbi:protein-domain-containing protein [Lobosporangium transversale]|uniref:Protein-domain-containing protein n=1 Tax=Lobosporangium transversale TaxID=64571 RepID=A0A1Y2GRD8_9FUNG|nr:protein-domain-containing protein [Lobosporangium transversale]ORZ20083.1 protein-domain-containing protein [Lobosporangium transversale]|eukprot:XP_021882623.1 protein-domain-containing protein [Lobosporangium transversale]